MSVPELTEEPSEHPDYPGWLDWKVGEEQHFTRAIMGPILGRCEGDVARIRIIPREEHKNLNGIIHGGIVMAHIDGSMFAGSTLLIRKDLRGSATVELNTHFVGAGDPEKPLDCLVEIVKETGKLIFCRGTVVQDEDIVASFSGILRKLARR